MTQNSYQDFKESYKRAAALFNSWDKSKPIRLISHLDADGVSAASIMIKTLNQENRRYSISIVQQLTNEVIDELSFENYKYYIFTDLGSGQINYLKEKLSDRDIIILDHHEPESMEPGDNKLVHINPHLQGIDGSIEISGSGVVYFFTKKLGVKEDLAHVAIIGAIGDIQEDHGFKQLNKEILETAVENNKIKVITGLRMFGVQTKPLHKVLEYCSDPYIPGVTGSESGAIQFLQQLGINPKIEGKWKKLVHLSDEDLKKLATGIVMKRIEEVNPEDILGPVYLLKQEKNESPTRDAKEFATLLNACGRMGKASLGIGACLGDKEIKERAIRSLTDYKREIVNALNWYNANKSSSNIIKGKGYMIINAGDKVLGTIIGTLASILSKSNEIEDNTYIMSLAQLKNSTTKVSLRIAGIRPNKDIDAREVMKDIVEKVGGEAGGHQFAAGAVIPTAKEKDFLDAAKEVLGKKGLEEAIVG
ncbi:DHH family phosphoesterase [Candidatus Woesearchaeota archaeon]|nr:DHH family phosphoesterase [Candidatus Woesearchaeota archaeon]